MLIALETTHRAATSRNYNANIVSTTQEEAADKLMTGGMLWASIPMDFEPLGFKPIKYKDAQDALAFHMPPYTSTITSKPGTSAIRGGKKDMYYDEAAFIKEFATLFQAGLPAITRGEGRVTVVSTPYGESGLYHELWQAENWSHHEIPWWESRFMVKGAIEDDKLTPNYEPVEEAMALAPEMDTLSRVDAFGSEKLKEILHIGCRDDLMVFQTEYECQFIDEAEAYFPWDLVNKGRDTEQEVWTTYPEGYEPKGDISIGVDLAKKRDESVFTVVEHAEDGTQKVLYVYATQRDYEEQFYILKELAKVSRARRVSIDATGPGQMFFEKAQREGFGPSCHAEGISFTNLKKEEWATKFKGDLQTGTITYPNHSELLNQIHGIKRTKTVSNFFKFAGDPDDYFWSLMLAMYGEGHRPVRFHKLG